MHMYMTDIFSFIDVGSSDPLTVHVHVSIGVIKKIAILKRSDINKSLEAT